MQKNHIIMEFSQMNKQVFLGTNACCAIHFESDLLDRGVTCDISLEGERLDQPFGIDCFLWLPTVDHTPPSIHNTLVGVAALTEMLKEGRSVYIHCKNGHGRAPTFFAAYLILQEGLDMEDALARITAKRPEVHLEPSQKQFLASLISKR